VIKLSDIKAYGDTQDEMEVQDRIQCREIVNEIMNFGITQPQILQLIFLLSLEVENIDIMKFLSSAVKKAQKGDIKSSALIV
jgi:hypothetical protein